MSSSTIDLMHPLTFQHPGVHETVLGKGGLIVENLANVDALLGEGNDVSDEWGVSFVPLYLGGAEDDSPVRAFAWRC